MKLIRIASRLSVLPLRMDTNKHELLQEPVLKMWSNYQNEILMHPSIICEYIMSDLSLWRQTLLKKWNY
jgi:hypothetical protein